MFSVTSKFKSLAENTVNRPVINFTFSGSTEDARLLGAATISRDLSQFSANRLSVDIANTVVTSPFRASLNILQNDKTHFFRNGNYGISFIDSDGTSSENFILFSGKLTSANYRGQKVSLNFLDKYEELNKRFIGGGAFAVVNFINSDWNPADLFWTIATSWGRLDATTTTSNTDIDYTSWLAWKANASALTLSIQAQFQGESVVTAIKKISGITNSVIIGEANGKIYTSLDLPTANTSAFTLCDSVLYDLSLMIDTNEIINQGTIFYGYNVSSATFTGSYITADSTSVNTYGQREKVYSDTVIWHSTKTSAELFLNWDIALLKNPMSQFRAELGYSALPLQMSDALFIISSPLSQDGTDSYTLTGVEHNIINGIATLSIKSKLGNGYFFLDDTTLGLLDQAYNPIF